MDYLKARDQTALKLLTKMGARATYTRVTPGVVGGSGEAVGGSVKNLLVSGVLTAFQKREIDGDTIRIGDMRFLVEATAFARAGTVPAVGDTVTINGEKWRVMEPNPVAPGGIPVIYKMQVRR